MKINRSREKPPIYDQCVELFGAKWGQTIFTYGDTIHSKHALSSQKLAHEKVHVNQQLSYGVEAWWSRYFIDPKFRLNQELEAYIAEAIWIRANEHNLQVRATKLNQIAIDLSGPLYGNILTLDEAKQLFRNNLTTSSLEVTLS